MIGTVVLLLIGAPLLFAAYLAVSVRNLVHAVLWLGVALAATAALFVAVEAPFLATVQVLLYIGGIVTLLIFGVMLTNRSAGAIVSRDLRGRVRAAVVAVVLFAAMATAILRSGDAVSEVAPTAASTADLAEVLLGKDLLAFEALSLLLLAAMVGAIVLARPRDFGAPRGSAARPRDFGAPPRTSAPPSPGPQAVRRDAP